MLPVQEFVHAPFVIVHRDCSEWEVFAHGSPTGLTPYSSIVRCMGVIVRHVRYVYDVYDAPYN